MRNHKELIGKTFNCLTFMEITKQDKKHNRYGLFRCKCGKMKEICIRKVESGQIKSCGCLSKENHFTKHNESGTRLYSLWRAMRNRCYSKKSSSYERYGAAGIVMCDEWKEDFLKFKEWSLLNGYNDSLTIDRIDNDGIYEPTNCRWTTVMVQANNKKNNHQVTAFGETKTITNWTYDERCVVSRDLLYERISRGCDPEKAITKHSQCKNGRSK